MPIIINAMIPAPVLFRSILTNGQIEFKRINIIILRCSYTFLEDVNKIRANIQGTKKTQPYPFFLSTERAITNK